MVAGADRNSRCCDRHVASVWARAASTMAAGARTAAELSGGRFILGIGTNNHVSAAMRGLAYDRPVSFMREYLRAMKIGRLRRASAQRRVPVLLAAGNPRMLALAGSDAHGTITYFVTPEHTARARRNHRPQAPAVRGSGRDAGARRSAGARGGSFIHESFAGDSTAI